MNLKKIILIILLAVVIFTLITSFLIGHFYEKDKIFPLFISFHLVGIIYLLGFFLLFVMAKEIIWIALSPNLRNKYKKRKDSYNIKIFLSTFLFFLVILFFNHYIYSYEFDFWMVLGNISVLAIFLTLSLILLNSTQMKLLTASGFGFLILLSILFSFIKIEKTPNSHDPSKDKLGSLPYAKWVSDKKNIKKRGVIKYDSDKSFSGINLYCLSKPHAFLLDINGELIHEWKFKNNFPNIYSWGAAELCSNGDILCISKKRILIKMSINSSIEWTNPLHFHHDVDINEKGEILSLTHNFEVKFHSLWPLPIGNNYIVKLSPEGKVIRKISLYEIFKEQITPKQIKNLLIWLINPKDYIFRIEESILPPREVFNDSSDIFHCNTIELIKRNIKGPFRKDNVITCPRNLDLIGVIDMKKEKLVWSWGKNILDRPHNPTLLKNSNILIFDNGTHRGYSRIVELDPFKERIVWDYTADPPESFFSSWGGSCQRLPNGNTLITESTKGRVFEVTKNGEIVWEFFSPIINENKEKRWTIYRMRRIVNLDKFPFLKEITN